MKKRAILSLALALLLGGCGNHGVGAPTGDAADSSTAVSAQTPDSDVGIPSADMFTDRDLSSAYDANKAVQIKLNGSSAFCEADSVRISGSTVTILEEGTFILSGTLDDGMIVVNADEKAKPHIILNGASVTSTTSAALYILEADKAIVTLADGTVNTLANTGSFTAIDENNIDGAVFSRQDLTFNGDGALTVTCVSDHGIVCKDDLVFTGGSFTVKSASHALDANDSVRLTGASLTLTAGKDGIHAENTEDASLGFFYMESGALTIEAEGDGISAGSYACFAGGSVTILAGGGYENGASRNSGGYGGFPGGAFGGFSGSTPGEMPGGAFGGSHGGTPGERPGGAFGGSPGGAFGETPSGAFGGTSGGAFGETPGGFSAEPSAASDDSTSMKGIKAAGTLLISGGTFSINSADDAVHSNTAVTVNGGTFTIASGDDGFHADETLNVTAGTIRISNSYEGLEALHIAVSGGDIQLTARDDGLNAAGGTDSSGMGGRDDGRFGGRGGMPGGASDGSILISGGNLYINASGDGIDANGTLEITGGYTVVVGPTSGDTATLDYDRGGVISGGTFVGTGASGMAQTFSDSENQGVIFLNVGQQPAGTAITVQDADGRTLITHTPELPFAVVIVSSPDIAKGAKYTVTVGSSSGEFEAK